MKFTLLATLFFLLSACTSAQLIRSTDYYPLEHGMFDSQEGQRKYIQHHPTFANLSVSKEGRANYTRELSYYFFGLFPRKQSVSIDEACGKEPFRQAYVSNGWLQGIVSILTVGIYTPRTVEVWCGPPRT